MKKLLLISAVLFSTHIFSQNYTFTQSTGTYANLSGSTSVVDWQKISTGFTFNFFNQNYDSLYVRTGGYIFFNDIASPKVVISAFDTPDNTSIPGAVSYQLAGIVGSQIFKLEWKNVILNSNSNQYINYQMWLYEGTNCIEIFIGPNGSMPSSSYGSYAGPSIGIGLPETTGFYSLSGNPNAPNFILANDSTLTGTPLNGTIYKFCTTGSGIFDNASSHSVDISPNPFSSSTTLQTSNLFHNATLTVDNCFGQTVKQIKNISGQTVVLSRDNLGSGLYFVRLTEENKIIAVDKLVIIDN